MNLLKRCSVSLLILLWILSGCSSKRMTGGEKPFFFFQMADPQFGMFANDSNFKKETINFTKAIAAANRLHPAFVIVCGDLVNQFVNEAEMDEYKRIAGMLDPSIPLYNVPGNHDVGTPQPTPKALDHYRKNFGKDYYTFRYQNLFSIVLNSSLFFDPAIVPGEASAQDYWLDSTLKSTEKLKDINIVVFQHIPWFLNEANEKNGYFNIPLERRVPYLDLLRKYGVKYVFAGHLHKNSFGEYKGLEMITTGPVGKPLGIDPSGFRIVTVNKNRLSYTYYNLDSIPKRMEFK